MLGEAQADNQKERNTIQVYAQEPQYHPDYEKILTDYLGIKIADWKTAEGITICDKNTIVVDFGATATVLEPIYDLNHPDGPAGILGDKVTYDHESY